MLSLMLFCEIEWWFSWAYLHWKNDFYWIWLYAKERATPWCRRECASGGWEDLGDARCLESHKWPGGSYHVPWYPKPGMAIPTSHYTTHDQSSVHLLASGLEKWNWNALKFGLWVMHDYIVAPPNSKVNSMENWVNFEHMTCIAWFSLDWVKFCKYWLKHLELK